MAGITGIRNLQSVSHCRSDEVKRVAPDVHVGDRLFDLRHVASDALVALATYFVVRVLFYCGRVRTVRRVRAVTIEA